jgi:hypothetical protein
MKPIQINENLHIKYNKEAEACTYKYFTPYNSRYRLVFFNESNNEEGGCLRCLKHSDDYGIAFRTIFMGYQFDSKIVLNFFTESLRNFETVCFFSQFFDGKSLNTPHQELIKESKNIDSIQCTMLIDDIITAPGNCERLIYIIKEKGILKEVVGRSIDEQVMKLYTEFCIDNDDCPPVGFYDGSSLFHRDKLFDLFEQAKIEKKPFSSCFENYPELSLEMQKIRSNIKY